MNKIPKNIFVYWHDKKLPYVVYKMYKNIKNQNKNFKIYKLNDKILKKKIKKIPKVILKNFDNKTIVSDWLRLYLLNKYGGVWTDISNIFLQSMDNIVDFNLDKLQAYKLYRVENGIENWFLASPPKTKLIKEWLKECLIAFEDKKKYYQLNSNYDTNNELISHLAQHLAFIKIINENNLFNNYKLLGDLYIEKLNYLPFHYQFEFKWNVYKLVHFLLNSKSINKNIKFIKLRGPERKLFIKFYEKNQYSNQSYIVKILKLNN